MLLLINQIATLPVLDLLRLKQLSLTNLKLPVTIALNCSVFYCFFNCVNIVFLGNLVIVVWVHTQLLASLIVADGCVLFSAL
jgi:hypothetical protein